jgi:hypothetical protein
VPVHTWPQPNGIWKAGAALARPAASVMVDTTNSEITALNLRIYFPFC